MNQDRSPVARNVRLLLDIPVIVAIMISLIVKDIGLGLSCGIMTALILGLIHMSKTQARQ